MMRLKLPGRRINTYVSASEFIPHAEASISHMDKHKTLTQRTRSFVLVASVFVAAVALLAGGFTAHINYWGFAEYCFWVGVIALAVSFAIQLADQLPAGQTMKEGRDG